VNGQVIQINMKGNVRSSVHVARVKGTIANRNTLSYR